MSLIDTNGQTALDNDAINKESEEMRAIAEESRQLLGTTSENNNNFSIFHVDPNDPNAIKVEDIDKTFNAVTSEMNLGILDLHTLEKEQVDFLEKHKRYLKPSANEKMLSTYNAVWNWFNQFALWLRIVILLVISVILLIMIPVIMVCIRKVKKH